MVYSGFENTVENSFLPIVEGANCAMNTSEFAAISCQLLKARKNHADKVRLDLVLLLIGWKTDGRLFIRSHFLPNQLFWKLLSSRMKKDHLIKYIWHYFSLRFSDGLGFTGVYIALDIGIMSHEESKTSIVDVFELTKNLRRDRHGIVSSLDRYNFIYQVRCF